MLRLHASRSSFVFALGLFLGLATGPGCVASIGNRSPEQVGTQSASAKAAKSDSDAAKAVAQARHDLEVAELELDLAHAKSAAEFTKRGEALALAEAERVEAETTLEVFLTSELPSKVGKGQLDLERARNRVVDAEAELAELEAMYAEEEFAASTKEIVLSRGRRNLSLSRRALELQEAEHARLVEHELPKQERALLLALEKKANALSAARHALERHELEQQLATTKAVRAGVKAEQELKEASEKLAESAKKDDA